MNLSAISSIAAPLNVAGPISAVRPNLPSLPGSHGLSANRPLGLLPEADEVAHGQTFDNILNAYLDLVNDAGRLEAQSQHLQVEYALGNHDDMLAVILAQEAAYTALHFTVQVTNRIIQAYQEIMRMQV